MNSRSFLPLLALLVVLPARASDDYSHLPNSRKAVVVDDSIGNPFQGSMGSVPSERIDAKGNLLADPEGLKTFREYVKQHPVLACAWDVNPNRRSVVIGDSILRVGSNISADLCPFADRYHVSDITQSMVVFEANGDSSFKIESPISLHETLRSAASGAKAKR